MHLFIVGLPFCSIFLPVLIDVSSYFILLNFSGCYFFDLAVCLDFNFTRIW